MSGMTATAPRVATTGSTAPPAAVGGGTADPLLGLLFPFWQLAIGFCVIAVTVAALYRVARRGRSRMGTALLVTGAAIVTLAVLGSLLGGH
jgi:uncharacterized BrkB/YihY/UPF0761 family membrane protein